MSKKYNFLIEIGCETLPPGVVKLFQKIAEEKLKNIFKEYRIEEYSSIEVYSSVRRLAVKVNQITSHQNSKVEKIKGPPYDIGIKDGEPTRAALGFAQNMDVDFDDLISEDTARGKYLFCVKKYPGKAVRKLLPELTEKFLKSLEFPANMRWPGSDFKFPRPVRWIIVKLGSKAVRFKIGNLKAGRSSRGHYLFSDRKIVIEDIENYRKKLRRNYVIVDPNERRETLLQAINRPLKYTTGYPVEREELLDEINNSVEYPTGVKGKFPKKYLDMPREIIEACLVYHQKFFPVENKQGKLMNYFVGVRDGISEYLEPIRRGYEKVLIARLKDAEFFFNKDRRLSLKEHVEKLKGVDFTRDLGTLYHKVNRVKNLSEYIADALNKGKKFKKQVKKISLLGKADLTTLTVEEFPELEGIIGRIYAELDGESKKVAQGIYQHYMPRTGEDDIPGTDVAAVVGVADRIDTLCGNLGKGLKATGSEDPFGLRRIGKGLLKILSRKKWDINFKDTIEKSLDLYAEQNIEFGNSGKKNLEDFLTLQIRQHLKENFKYDIVRCVMESNENNPVQLEKMARAVDYIKTEKDFDSLITAFKRINNILKQARKKNIGIPDKYDRRRLIEQTEKKLDKKYSRITRDIEKSIDNRNYRGVLELLISLRKDIDKYFEEVMVMSDDIKRCKNRLAMLKNIKEIFAPVGDITKLEVE
ncbi:MAG: glycine--tRNA ligase subunit beta [Elusimicrobiota bacterium]